MSSNKINILVSIFIAVVVFGPIVVAAIIQRNADSKTYVTVKDTKNTVNISVDASRTFTGYHWEDDGKTLIITYEEADHATD